MWKVVNVSLVALALQLASTVYAEPSLKLKITIPDEVNGVDNLLCTTTVTNTGDQDLSLYPEPNGVLSSFPAKTFKVTKASDQSKARFIGAEAKYSFANANNLVELKQGESKSFTHQLANAYEIPEEGTYEITAAIKTFYYKDPVTSKPVPLIASVDSTAKAQAKISGDLKARRVQQRKRYYERYRAKRSLNNFADAVKRSLNISGKKIELLQKRIEYANCNDQQEAEILQASYVASRYTADAEKFLDRNKQSTERYTTWFGQYDSTNHDTILSHFTKIRTSDLKTYTYDCTCEEENPENLYAYVFPDQFGHVHLCGQFMSAAVQGADSKAGTMVHEATHFTANGGTSDIAYSRELAMELAATNTTGAVLNADSHEYFAENVPKLG